MAWTEDTSKRGRKVKVEVDSATGQKRATLTIHDQHFHDGSTWQAVDESLVTDGADGFARKCEKTAHIVRMGNGGARRWYPRRNVPTEYVSMDGWQYWRVSGGGSWRPFTLPTPTWGAQTQTWDMTNLKATLTNTWRRVKAEFVLKNSSAYTRLRFSMTLVGLTMDADWKLTSIADSTVVGWLDPPTAYDANGIKVPCTATYSGGYVEWSVDTTGATFPITVDPTFTDGNGGDVQTYFDGMLVESTPDDYTQGSATTFDTSNGAGARKFPHMKFTVSSLAGSTVTSSTLSLFIGFQVDYDVTETLYSILSANSGITEDASWNHRDGATASAHWAGDAASNGGTDAGCSVSGTDYNGTSMGSISRTADAVVGTEFTSALSVSQTQAWIDTGNYGLVMSGNSGFSRWCSSDHATAGYRPKLVIVTEGAGGGEGSAGGTLTAIRTNAQPPFWGRF